MHTGLSSSDEGEVDNAVSTLLIGEEENIDLDEDIFSDDNFHLSQLQSLEIERADIDYGQNCISWQQFITNTAFPTGCLCDSG